jgi:hypothetical protein
MCNCAKILNNNFNLIRNQLIVFHLQTSFFRLPSSLPPAPVNRGLSPFSRGTVVQESFVFRLPASVFGLQYSVFCLPTFVFLNIRYFYQIGKNTGSSYRSTGAITFNQHGKFVVPFRGVHHQVIAAFQIVKRMP